MKIIMLVFTFCLALGTSARAAEVVPDQDPNPDFSSLNIPLSMQSIEAQEAAAQRALKAYDESMAKWRLPPNYTDDIVFENVCVRERFSSRTVCEFDTVPAQKHAFLRESGSGKLQWSKQKVADQIADMIYPGLGRIERRSTGRHSRFDYISPKRCGLRGWGICWQVTFQ